MRIELLYFEGCPGVAETLRAIETVVDEGELKADVAAVEAASGNHPGFSGSPTVLVREAGIPSPPRVRAD